MSKKIIFTEFEIGKIKSPYSDGLSCEKIGKEMGISKQPIKGMLHNLGLIRKGYSTGVKLNITNEQKDKIREMYLGYYSISEIAYSVGLSKPMIDKLLQNSGYRRDKSSGVSIGLVKRYRGMKYDDYMKIVNEFYQYELEVLKITRRQQIESLQHFLKRGSSGVNGAYHLDHKYSIIEGFKNNINPNIIGDIKNLEFIPWEENIKKRTKCSITIDELINN